MAGKKNTPRNVVLVLGNGFDLDIGRKTSYRDFFSSSYCPKYYPSPLINYLNSRFGQNNKQVRWFDLENELYAYSTGHEKEQDVISSEEKSLIKNITAQLDFSLLKGKEKAGYNKLLRRGVISLNDNKYIKISYKNDISKSVSSRDRISLELIKKSLRKYLKTVCIVSPAKKGLAYYLLLTLYGFCQRHKIIKIGDLPRLIDDSLEKSLVSPKLEPLKSSDQSGNLRIYSFNYTDLPWGFNKTYRSYFSFVHGSCSGDNIIIGTRDEGFEKEYSFLQKSFDKSFSPPPIVDNLDIADSVIFYGHSLGYNDRQYFKSFFMKQAGFGPSSRKRITFITKNDETVEEIKTELQKMTDNSLSVLMSKNTVRFIKTDLIKKEEKPVINLFVELGLTNKIAKDIVAAM